MKAFTNIEQSKTLAKILPHESADMALCGKIQPLMTDYISAKKKFSNAGEIPIDPCWSLSALLDFLESEIDGEEGETYQLNIEKEGTLWYIWYKEQYDEASPIVAESTEELVDACYELIIKLKELNLL